MTHTSAVALLALALAAAPAAARNWSEIESRARGQTVYFNAWAGDERTNNYIAWAADRIREDYGVELRHVKIADAGETVARVLAEKTAGRTEDGSVDLVWINGENFKAMLDAGLLGPPFAFELPNFRYVDVANNPATVEDFTVPTEGRESPWGTARLTFMRDSARVPEPPRSFEALTGWILANPGRFTYPAPPDFIGSTFLKQALIELTPDRSVLARPVEEADFDAATASLWAWLDEVEPALWRGGRSYPASSAAFRQLLADAEIDVAFSFNPSDASSAIAQGLLPDTVRSFTFDDGTIGNAHFVAVPFNASAPEAAQVVANFLLSPEAQARKVDPRVWGDPTVLALHKLPPEERALFEALPRGVADLPPDQLGRALPEPHPSWMTALETEWRNRYAR